jgi:hypothetical protein
MSGFMGSRINAACPVCGAMMHPSLEDVRMERTVYCPNGHQVKLVDKGDGIQKFDREMDKLTRQLRRAGVTIKFRRR